MEVYKSAYKTTDYDSTTEIMLNRWTDAEMDQATFQKEIIAWVELMEKYHAKYMIANTKEFNFVINVDMQTWTGETVFPRLLAAGMKKFAIIVTADILTQLALEQTMEEEKTGQFQTRYFDNEEDAIQWMKK